MQCYRLERRIWAEHRREVRRKSSANWPRDAVECVDINAANFGRVDRHGCRIEDTLDHIERRGCDSDDGHVHAISRGATRRITTKNKSIVWSQNDRIGHKGSVNVILIYTPKIGVDVDR